MHLLLRCVSGLGVASLLAISPGVVAQDWTTGVTGNYTIINTTNGSMVPFTIEANTATNSMFLDSTGNVGLGTSTPGGTFSARIHIADPTPDILLDDIDNSQLWYLFADYEGMGFADETGSSIPFYVESAAPFDSLRVKANGNVGVGTDSATQKLHVLGDSGTSILVENTDISATGDQVMFQLSNASTAKVRFAISSDGGNIWTFDNTPDLDAFSISKVGTGVNEFLVSSNGDGTFRGRSFATEHVNTSSRSAKTGFAEIDEDVVLSQLVALPVTQWRYKTDEKGMKHVGPVAEDFQDVFGLGDGTTISTVDASGIALAAIKALKRQQDSELAEKDAEISSLKAQLESQARRMVQIELMLGELLSKKSEDVQIGLND